MAGCDGGSCGIGKQRDRERDRALVAISRAYPTLGRSLGPRGEARAPLRELESLGTKLEQLLPVRAFVRAADRAGECDWLYLLAGLSDAALIAVSLGLHPGPPAEERETYVRVGFSPLGPFATLQETELSLDRPTMTLAETPHVGIDDRRLQAIVKCLQGALRKEKIALLDAAFLCEPLGDQGALRWHFLFEDEAPGTPRWSLLTPLRNDLPGSPPGLESRW